MTFNNDFGVDQDDDVDESGLEYKKPVVKLVGEDGNVFNVIGKVSKALNKAGLKDKAESFTNKAFNASSYNEVIKLCQKYVKVV